MEKGKYPKSQTQSKVEMLFNRTATSERDDKILNLP